VIIEQQNYHTKCIYFKNKLNLGFSSQFLKKKNAIAKELITFVQNFK